MNIFGVHMDRKSTMPMVEELISDLHAEGAKTQFFNTNAADPEHRAQVLDAIAETVGPGGGVRVLMHSIAFGALKPFLDEDSLSQKQMEMTADVMGHSLVYWVQDLVRLDLLKKGSRVFSMTSGGSGRVVESYGAVSAAKAALESHTRQLALELAPRGVLVNALMGGLTDTPALRAIPGHEHMIQQALRFNPSGRMTTPEDIAGTVVALANPDLVWITGEVIRVDGGEYIVGF